MRKILIVLALAALPLGPGAPYGTLPAHAQAASPDRAAESGAVLDALRVTELLEVMQAEAVAAGAELDDGMLGGRGGERWRQTIARINRPERLEPPLRGDFARALSGQEAAPILDFLGSPEGRRIVGLEISARRALLDEAVEAASEAALAEAMSEDDPRLDLIRRFVDANDLIDTNVVGALNANAAFLRGLTAGGGGAVPMSEDDIIDQVRAQEPQIRENTTEWVLSFLNFAYRPLSDAELRAYIAFSETPAGQALNDALFQAFDAMFVATARATGEAAAQVLSAEDI